MAGIVLLGDEGAVRREDLYLQIDADRAIGVDPHRLTGRALELVNSDVRRLPNAAHDGRADRDDLRVAVGVFRELLDRDLELADAGPEGFDSHDLQARAWQAGDQDRVPVCEGADVVLAGDLGTVRLEQRDDRVHPGLAIHGDSDQSPLVRLETELTDPVHFRDRCAERLAQIEDFAIRVVGRIGLGGLLFGLVLRLGLFVGRIPIGGFAVVRRRLICRIFALGLRIVRAVGSSDAWPPGSIGSELGSSSLPPQAAATSAVAMSRPANRCSRFCIALPGSPALAAQPERLRAIVPAESVTRLSGFAG